MKQQQQKNQQNGKNTFKIINQSDFKFLQEVASLKEANQKSLRQKSIMQILSKSEPVTNTWFKLFNPEYVLYEVDQQKKTIKIYQKHKTLKFKNQIRWGTETFTMTIDKWRHFTQSTNIALMKNYIDGSYASVISHSKQKISENQDELKVRQIQSIAINLQFNRWLTPTIHQDSKTISYLLTKSLTSNYFRDASFRIFLGNRQNFRNQPQKQTLGQSPVLKSSDILGFQYNLSTRNGLLLKFNTGYNFFNRSYCNKFGLMYKKYVQYKDFSVEFKARAAAIYGKNIQINDYLRRNQSRFMPDPTTSYINPRLNIIINKYHETLSSLRIYPYFYLQAWMSRNQSQRNKKYQFDYGIGVRINQLYVDWSLLRIGKNIDQIGGPSIKFNF